MGISLLTVFSQFTSCFLCPGQSGKRPSWGFILSRSFLTSTSLAQEDIPSAPCLSLKYHIISISIHFFISTNLALGIFKELHYFRHHFILPFSWVWHKVTPRRRIIQASPHFSAFMSLAPAYFKALHYLRQRFAFLRSHPYNMQFFFLWLSSQGHCREFVKSSSCLLHQPLICFCLLLSIHVHFRLEGGTEKQKNQFSPIWISIIFCWRTSFWDCLKKTNSIFKI